MTFARLRTFQKSKQMRYLFLPQCLCFGMDADTEDLEEREGRRAMTSTVERECCIYLEHDRGKKTQSRT